MVENNRAANIVDAVVGSNLRMMRISVKMSQTTLADQVGVTFQQIQKYEKGSNRIGASRMWRFCEIFCCEPGAFFVGLTESKKSVAFAKVPPTDRTDFFQHPRGAAMAKAFLSLGNPEVEKQIIAMCRTLSVKKTS